MLKSGRHRLTTNRGKPDASDLRVAASVVIKRYLPFLQQPMEAKCVPGQKADRFRTKPLTDVAFNTSPLQSSAAAATSMAGFVVRGVSFH
jgi:hypothetical protein